MRSAGPEDERQPRYPATHAFVVQFEAGPGDGDQRPGRIEHVTSGRSGRFENGAALMTFLFELLSSLGNDESGAGDGPRKP